MADWVSELAPKRLQSFLSYITGWLVSLGWVSYLTLTSFTAATTIQGLAVLNHPGYTPQPWHATLLTWAVVSFGFLFNTVLAPRLPAIEVIFFLLHVVGWFGIFVTLLVMAPRHDPVDTFTTFYDGGTSALQDSSFRGISDERCRRLGQRWSIWHHHDDEQYCYACRLRVSGPHVYVTLTMGQRYKTDQAPQPKRRKTHHG